MKKNVLWIMALGVFLGYSTPVLADSPIFPLTFNTSFANSNTNTLVKVEGTKLRISVTSLDGAAIKDYSMDVEDNTIASSPGNVVTKGTDDYTVVYQEVMDSLNAVKSGLADSGDTTNSESVETTISYIQSLV